MFRVRKILLLGLRRGSAILRYRGHKLQVEILASTVCEALRLLRSTAKNRSHDQCSGSARYAAIWGYATVQRIAGDISYDHCAAPAWIVRLDFSVND